MRTYTIAILTLIALGVGFNYIFQHRDVIIMRMDRFCNAWADCGEAGERINSNNNVTHDVFGR